VKSFWYSMRTSAVVFGSINGTSLQAIVAGL
jgi:hypothetical protein